MKKKYDLGYWLRNRPILKSRPNCHEVLSRFKIRSQFYLTKKRFGLNLSDSYWIFPCDNPMKWEDVN